MTSRESGSPVAVCGAGAAGMAAAIAIARTGIPVELIEASSSVGGTMADTLLHTIAGLYDSNGHYLNGGLPAEIAERLLDTGELVHRRRMGRVWVLNVDPNVYRDVTRALVGSELAITVRLETRVSRVHREGARVVALELDRAGGIIDVPVRSVVDATGCASVVRAIDEALVQREETVAAGGWIFRMRGIAAGAFSFPRNVAVVRSLREAAEAGVLPKECSHAWIDSGVFEDEIFVKLFVPLAPGWSLLEAQGGISEVARKTQHAVANFLTTLPGFERAVITQTGKLGIRDGGRALGEYVLRREDVVGLLKCGDAACRAAWPIEYWDSQNGVTLEYLPDGEYYEIPLRALKVRELDNVWVAGKCLSADAHAQASARSVGTCWAMGAAAGSAAVA